ncbi:pentapeptide repeat-containing protein [Streptomyces chartreusis]
MLERPSGMPYPRPQPPPTPPDWPICGHGPTPENPVGCHGIHVPGHTACLTHLADSDRSGYLAGLAPGDDIDHRGTTFDDSLLRLLLGALRDPATGHPRLGRAAFTSATFESITSFESVTFEGESHFGSATFQGHPWFRSATFKGNAVFGLVTFEHGAGFESATFEANTWFGQAAFQGTTSFYSTTFKGDAGFGFATFKDTAGFSDATFQGTAGFRSVAFQRDAQFESAAFEDNAVFESTAFQGTARFRSATFHSDTGFDSATFHSDAYFDSATFHDNAKFSSTTFQDEAGFSSATFQSDAGFDSATFQGTARFRSATFQSNAGFDSATFHSDAYFDSATFHDNAKFSSTTFQGNASLQSAILKQTASLGPLVCAGWMNLSEAVFSNPVTLLLAARHLEFRRTRWSSTAELRLRYASVNFAHAVFEYPLTIAAEPVPFMLPSGEPVVEQALAGAHDATVRVASLRGVDAAHLVLSDVDLSGCLFTGTVHLDQLRLEGTCSFSTVPPRTHWRRWRPVRFTQRRTLAEEHHWRASRLALIPGWNAAESGAVHIGPAQLAPVYRALRKAYEDGKNEPGAADFYYGEMEMRRHDRTGTTRAERGLLHGYWLLSGYGLRASRALGWLAASMLVTIVLLMGFGLPKNSPKQEATGTVPPGGGKVTFEIDKADTQNPAGERFTSGRFEKALNATLNSVVFRASGQDLTTAGTYIEMASRVTEPILLGLAVLAVRNRVKR